MCPNNTGSERRGQSGRAGAKNESGTEHARSSSLMRRLIILGIFFVVPLLLLTVMVHDMLRENLCVRKMSRIGRHVKEYRARNNRLPGRETLQEFEYGGKKLSLKGVDYDTRQILDESGPDTVLAHAPTSRLRFLPRGYAVLYLNGAVELVSAHVLDNKLKERERFYKSAISE